MSQSVDDGGIQVVCVAVCCSVLQCVAVFCSMLQSVGDSGMQILVYCSVWQCVAVCCSVMQCAAGYIGMQEHWCAESELDSVL